MKPVQKFITVGLWGVLVLAMVGVVVAKFLLPNQPKADQQPDVAVVHVPDPHPAHMEKILRTPDFALIDQDGKPFASSDLRGRPYVAALIFTNCAGVCPRMTTTMRGLQPKLPADVHLVSFSVDPVTDTPPVLKQYAQAYGADESRWHFLTGTKDKVMAVIEGIKLPFQDKSETGPIIHSEKLVLIDAEGDVRGVYDSNDEERLKRLVVDAPKLVEEAKRSPPPPPPAAPAPAKATVPPSTGPAGGTAS